MGRSVLALATFLPAFVHAEPSLILSRDFVANQNVPEGGELLNVQTVDYGDATISDVHVGFVLSGQNGDPMANGDWYAGLGYDAGGYAVLLNRVGKTASSPFGYLDNGFDVTFRDDATDIHSYQNTTGALGSAPLTGEWSPSGRQTLPENVLDTTPRTAMLSGFDGRAAAGEWQLLLSHEATGGAAKLESWGLEMRVTPVAAQALRFSTGDRVRTSDALTSLTSEITIAGDVTFEASCDIVSGGSLRGSGTVRQQGMGSLVLSEDGDFSGQVLVTNGRLQVVNTTGSATGSASVSVSEEGILSGPGRIGGPVSIFDGGIVSPGSSPGTLTVGGDMTWGEDGAYPWEINDALGTLGADPGRDWIDIGGQLTLASSAENPFTLLVQSLNLLNAPGAVSGFDGLADYIWTIATAGSIAGFDPDHVGIDASDFHDRNSAPGTFSVVPSGGNINLHYTAPIPEPGTYVLGAGLCALLFTLLRRRTERFHCSRGRR